MINVNVTMKVVSEVPGRVGNWALRRLLWYPAVPRANDFVELDTEGDLLARVRRVRWPLHGPPVVELDPLHAYGADEAPLLDAYDQLTDQGWTRDGGPWQGQAG